jgi:hydrogenase maturation protein HypF
VTAQLDLAAPTSPTGIDPGRRRARAQLDNGGPIAVHAVVTSVTDLAGELGLGGFVRTDPHGVTVEVEGRAGAVAAFLARISAGPFGACWTPGGELAPMGAGEFAVLAVSARRTAAAAHRGFDVSLCAACVEVLFDRAHPRFLDPTIGCPGCRRGDTAGLDGEQRSELRLIDPAGRDIEGNPLKSAMALLLIAGRILATRDAQRTRLYADATRPAAVAALAALTDQAGEARLVALCPDVAWVRRLALLDEAEAAALTSRRGPVLLVEPHPVGPARDLTPPNGLLAVTLPGCGMTHLMARAAARPLAYLDLPEVAGTEPIGPSTGSPTGAGPVGVASAIGTLFAQRVS